MGQSIQTKMDKMLSMLTTPLGDSGVARRRLLLTRERLCMRRVGLSLASFLISIVCLGVLPAQAMVDTGLIGYWSFDGCSFADDSGNGHHGIAGGKCWS